MVAAAVLRWVESLESQIHEIHSFMLMQHGKVLAEGWWSPYGRTHPHMLFSLSKSFTSTAVGLAASEGCFSIDDPVVSFFPDETPAEVSDLLAAMRVRHLLSMSTGHDTDTFPPMLERADGQWIKAFFEVPVVHQPGTHFLYNTGATYLLSAIVQKTTGQKLIDYLQPRLFAPLGIEHPTWADSPEGISLGGIGLSIRTQDIARFGQLYLQKGRWEGRQLIPEAWIDEATAAQVSNGDDPQSDWAQGYGYQFWRCRHDAYRADGAFGQYCIVMPKQDAVLAITSGIGPEGMQPPLDLIWDKLLPALNGNAADDDPAAQQRLTEKLADLRLRPVQGEADSPLAASISNRVYRVEDNVLGIETLAVHLSDTGCTFALKTASGEITLPCGLDAWLPGQFTLFRRPGMMDSTTVVTSAAWTTSDVLTTVIRFYETPFFYTLRCQFAGDDLTVDIDVNASFEPLKTLRLTAHA